MNQVSPNQRASLQTRFATISPHGLKCREQRLLKHRFLCSCCYARSCRECDGRFVTTQFSNRLSRHVIAVCTSNSDRSWYVMPSLFLMFQCVVHACGCTCTCVYFRVKIFMLLDCLSATSDRNSRKLQYSDWRLSVLLYLSQRLCAYDSARKVRHCLTLGFSMRLCWTVAHFFTCVHYTKILSHQFVVQATIPLFFHTL